MAGEADKKDHTKINDEIAVDIDAGRPKSKKELRLEKKAARKKLAEEENSKTAKKTDNIDGNIYLEKEEYIRLKKLRRKEQRKEQEKLIRKELEEEKKIRKRKKLNRELNAKGGAKKKQKTIESQNSLASEDSSSKSSGKKRKKDSSSRDEQDVTMDAFRSVLYGTSKNTSQSGGMTTTRLGVQYQDKVVGTGKILKEGRPITVKYELTGGKFGAVLDSSKKFTFRPGMGEVIQGWDIGLEGMREGGRRKLIIPPKAGYGGKDIGAGPGALLYFDVTLISCGR